VSTSYCVTAGLDILKFAQMQKPPQIKRVRSDSAASHQSGRRETVRGKRFRSDMFIYKRNTAATIRYTYIVYYIVCLEFYDRGIKTSDRF